MGVTDQTQVGIGRINFRARKPLSVRLELPSFLVQQDTQKITAIVTNDTGQDQDVNVRMEVQGVQVQGTLSQKVHVSATRPLPLTWDVATPNSGDAKFTVRAWVDNGASDAEGRTLSIQPHGRLLLESHAGEIRDQSSAIFTLSQTADKNNGKLSIDITPSVGASVYQSLDELIDFPYGCTEQTMSRFLPTVLLSHMLKEQNIRTDLEAKVPSIVASGYSRLAKMQHADGSWGWWEYDTGDFFMTAYVLDGLKRSEAAGYPNDKVDTTKTFGLDQEPAQERQADRLEPPGYLVSQLRGGALRRRMKRPSKAWPWSSRPPAPSGLSSPSPHHAMGDAGGQGEALAHLHDLAKIESDMARFDGAHWDYGFESVAFPLIALSTLTPQDPLIPKLVRYLMVGRKGDMWNSTRDSALALVGLTQYMATIHDNGKPVDIEVSVNGATPHRVHFDPADILSPSLKITIPITELHAGPNQIEFHRTSTEGLCYFSGELKQTELADRLLPVRDTAGLNITRNYYLLEPQRMEDGQLQLRPSKRAIDQAHGGDLIQVELTINSNADREFIMIEDPIPSGCRITEREYLAEGEEWGYWWSQTIVRDDKAAFFMRELPKGTQTLTYTMRAEQFGLGHALPSTISNMYDPAQFYSGGESLLKVTE